MGGPSADGARGNHVGVEVAAVGAFDGAGAESFSHEQGLHFTEFERAKYTADSRDAATVALRLVDGFFHQGLATLVKCLLEHSASAFANLIVGDGSYISGDATSESRPH